MPKNTGYGAGTWQNSQIEANAGNFAGDRQQLRGTLRQSDPATWDRGSARRRSTISAASSTSTPSMSGSSPTSSRTSGTKTFPYPSLGVMSRASGMSKRQLQRYSDELQGMGYLSVLPRRSQERGQEFELLRLRRTIRATGNAHRRER